jgi:hypothetical protein
VRDVKKKTLSGADAKGSSKSERGEADSAAPMGYAATRTPQRIAAAMGELEAAPIQFPAAQDIPCGGVLLAVPALLAMGLLRHSAELYSLPQGYYGLSSILLLLAMMALVRLKSVERLRYVAPGEWGNLLGLDRIAAWPACRHSHSSLARKVRTSGVKRPPGCARPFPLPCTFPACSASKQPVNPTENRSSQRSRASLPASRFRSTPSTASCGAANKATAVAAA